MKFKLRTILCHFVVIVSLIVPSLVFTSCSAEENQPAYSAPVSDSTEVASQKRFRSISGAEAQAMMNQKKDLLVVDVRTPQERSQVRLTGSQPIPIGDVMRGRLTAPKEQPLLVVCAVGGRSYVASKALLAMGHQEVYNLEGGIEAWRRAHLPVETGPEKMGTN